MPDSDSPEPSVGCVVVTETLDQVCADWLAQRARVVWVRHDDAQAMARALLQADGLLVRTYTRVDEALLAQAPRLRVVGRAGVGLDNIDVSACRRRGIEVVYTPDANTQAVVEYVLGLMLDVFRPRTPLPAHADDALFHRLRQTEVGTQLNTLTLGIVGLGRIGKRIGQIAHALGMNLLVCDLLPEDLLRRAVSYPFDFVDHVTLYRGSDIVTLHADGRPENRHMVDAVALSHLRDRVLFINAARGMLVDAHALAAWARAHPQARLMLDVHDPEPPPADYPLRNLPNVTLLPHLASRTGPALQNMSWVVRDVVAVLRGQAAQYPAP